MIELLAVIALLDLLATVAPRFGDNSLVNLGARAEARRLAMDLHQARRRAIAIGDNHLVSFQTGGGGSVVGYTVMRRLPDNSTSTVDQYHPLSRSVIATVSADPEFVFDGSATAAHTIVLQGPDRSWKVDVVLATGAVKTSEL